MTLKCCFFLKSVVNKDYSLNFSGFQSNEKLYTIIIVRSIPIEGRYNIPITTEPLIAIVVPSNELKKTQNPLCNRICEHECIIIFKVGQVP